MQSLSFQFHPHLTLTHHSIYFVLFEAFQVHNTACNLLLSGQKETKVCFPQFQPINSVFGTHPVLCALHEPWKQSSPEISGLSQQLALAVCPLQQTELSGRAGHNSTNPSIFCKTCLWQQHAAVKPKQLPWKPVSGQVVLAMLSSFSEEGDQDHLETVLRTRDRTRVECSSPGSTSFSEKRRVLQSHKDTRPLWGLQMVDTLMTQHEQYKRASKQIKVLGR